MSAVSYLSLLSTFDFQAYIVLFSNEPDYMPVTRLIAWLSHVMFHVLIAF